MLSVLLQKGAFSGVLSCRRFATIATVLQLFCKTVISSHGPFTQLYFEGSYFKFFRLVSSIQTDLKPEIEVVQFHFNNESTITLK